MGLLQTKSKLNKPKAPAGTPLKSLEEFPIPAYQFSVEIGGQTVALFMGVAGLSLTRAVEKVTEGGQNDFVYELPGALSYGHVTFSVGQTSSEFFWNWMTAGQFDGSAAKKDFTLVQRRPNPKGKSPVFEVVKRWNFYKSFPVSWKISDLTLNNTSAIVIESLELAFEHFERDQ